MKIQVVNKSKHSLPEYSTLASAGMDIRANLEEEIIIKPFERALIPTGLFLAIPVGYEIQVRPRSGLALKYGITVLNSPGTIDADYRGEIKVVLINLSQDNFVVSDGDRIAQIVLNKFETIDWSIETILADTERSDGGFGHTGSK